MRVFLMSALLFLCLTMALSGILSAAPYTALESPSNNAVITNCNQYFNWVLNWNGETCTYHHSAVEFYEDSSFMGHRSYPNISPSEYTNSCPVSWWPDNTVITWRVRIWYTRWWYGDVWTPWATRKFTTNFPGLEIQNPPNNAVSVTQTPTFSWSDYMDGDFSSYSDFRGGWEFLISDRSDFQDTLFIDSLPYGNYTGWTLAVTNPLGAGQEFYWKVKCHFWMGIGGWTNTGHFTTGCDNPNPPLLSLPANGAVVELHESAVDVSWHHIIKNDHYFIEIDEDDQFLSPVVSTGINGDGYTFNGAVEGTRYFWRVRADYDCGSSDWSEIRSFLVYCPKPAAPALTGPDDGASELDPEQVYLQWEDVDRADLFYLEVDDDNDFSSPVFVSQTDQTNDLCTGLAGAMTFYWHVRGYHQTCGYGDWSATRYFSVKEPTDLTESAGSNLPKEYRLIQNIPNPFNPSTTIQFELPRAGMVTIEITNVLGQEIATLAERRYTAGSWSIVWDGKDNYGKPVPSGIYLCRLTAGNYDESIKMMLVK